MERSLGMSSGTFFGIKGSHVGVRAYFKQDEHAVMIVQLCSYKHYRTEDIEIAKKKL